MDHRKGGIFYIHLCSDLYTESSFRPVKNKWGWDDDHLLQYLVLHSTKKGPPEEDPFFCCFS